MGKRLFTLGVVLTAILVIWSCLPIGAYAQSYYSVGISNSKLYLFEKGTGSSAWTMLHNFNEESISPSDVSVQGDYVFVSDYNTGKLHVFKISNTNGTFSAAPVTVNGSTDGGILLSGVTHPLALTVSSDGRSVYVIDSTVTTTSNVGHVKYASVTGADNWATASVQIGDIVDASLCNVAPLPTGSGAVVLSAGIHKEWGIPTQLTGINGGSTGNTAEASPDTSTDPKAFGPVSLAVSDSGYAYAINTFFGFTSVQGSISVFNASTPSYVNTYMLPDNMKPLASEIAAFSFGGINYLGIVGVSNAGEQIWRIQLDSSGNPMLDSIQKYTFDGSDKTGVSHYLTASADGQYLWVSSPNSTSNDVFALDNSGSWSSKAADFDLSEAIRQLDDYIYVAVPEPAGLITLSALGLSALGMLKLRRRR